MRKLANELRDARYRQNLTQRELAVRSNVAQGQISRIENGEVDPQFSTLLELARALGLEVELIPKAATPAVSAVIRETQIREGARDATHLLVKIHKRVSHFVERDRSNEALQRLLETIRDLILIAPAIQGTFPTKVLTRAVKQLDEIASDAQNITASSRQISEIVDYLQDFRNQLVHGAEERPAYKPDEDEE